MSRIEKYFLYLLKYLTYAIKPHNLEIRNNTSSLIKHGQHMTEHTNLVNKTESNLAAPTIPLTQLHLLQIVMQNLIKTFISQVTNH